MSPAFAVVLAYLIGSIPFGYLIVRLRGGGDVRETGSGGTGATNVTRRAGKWAGILTLLLDALKGTLVALLARRFLAEGFGVDWWVVAASLAAVVGHVFPVWLGFRGGKGVATGLGVFLGLAPLAVLCALPVFALVVWLTRYVSLGSITAAALLPLFVRLTGGKQLPLLTATVLGGALIVLMHRANIGRLLSGTENKLKL
ncbi:MAG TPA: glycerol-3-phosphate 1-O-acyltransferase PlsY [Pyrinomonadaceae bacterium]|jgi:glycerol-3-phosphate acyltransferase PlsY|nr:glycerol-3-phosphate 1-O-acyltransferase PlsY [Pyrinomonadaceae bacterium]